MSNHSSINEQINGLSERLKEAGVNVELGATGKFPEGKLTEHDEGEIKFAVGVHQGKVVIDFNKPVTWLGMLPEQAHALQENLFSGHILINSQKNNNSL